MPKEVVLSDYLKVASIVDSSSDVYLWLGLGQFLAG